MSHVAAEWAHVVTVHAAGYATRFEPINTPPVGVPIEGAGLDVLPLDVISPEFANVLGEEIDFSRAALNMDTDRVGVAFDVQPDEGSTLFYIQDRFPVPEDQSGATFEDGDMFALQLPASLARVSWSLPGNLESCTPMPYGVIASYEPNAFVVPVLPGGVTYVSYECTP